MHILLRRFCREGYGLILILQGSYEARCGKAKLLTIRETLDEEDMLQMWGIMSGKDVVDRKKLWQLASEVTGRGRAPRARVGHQEVVVTKPSKDCRKTCFATRTQLHWNRLPNYVKMTKTSKGFRKTYITWKELPDQKEYLKSLQPRLFDPLGRDTKIRPT